MLELTPSSPTRQPRRTASPSPFRRFPILAIATLALVALTTLPAAHAQDQWTPVGSLGPLLGVLVDPTDSSTLYVRGYLRGLSKSTDGGQSWAPIHQGLTEDGEAPWVAALAIDPLAPDVLYAAVHFPQPPFGDPISRLFRTVDGGLHWTPISSPTGALVEVLDVDPQQPNLLLAGGPGGSFRSTDAGTTWTRLAAAFGQLSLNALVRDPLAPEVMYASASEYPIDVVPDAETFLFKSVDRGANWTAVAQRKLVALAVAPGAPSKLYASDGSTQVLQSIDGGVTWTRAALLVEITRLLVDPTASTTLFAVGRDGVWRSDDGGTIFRAWNHGLANRDVTDLAFDPQLPTRLYATHLDGLSTRLSSSVTPAPACEAGPTQLCLEGGRFRAEVAWKDFSGNTGVGTTLPLTDDTGAFWFFGPDNIELTVKVLDGRPVNGKFWVFYGSLTNVEFTLTVTDTATHRTRQYHNPMGTFASAGHTDSF